MKPEGTNAGPFPNNTAKENRPATLANEPARRPAPNCGLHVLVVDDSLTVRMDLKQTFESAGFAVTACDGLAAAREALTRADFSLIILDVLLPDGDGLDLLREIKSCPARIPVMVLSTEAELGQRLRGLKIGADDYVGKPYDSAHLVARARDLTGNVQRAAKPAARRILLIEDSATFRQVFTSVLEGAGYEVITAADGEAGVQAAFVSRPDAIVVDGVLGKGMSGGAVIRRLKQDITLRTTPCLLLTASSEFCQELDALDSGADAYLSKETNTGVILARLSALLRPGRMDGVMESTAPSLLGSKKILAVDDSRTFLGEVTAHLREEGYDIIEAGSGKAALELLDVQAVDCILLDVRMPEMSGNEVCRIVKSRPELRNVPLLMLTAAEEPEAVIEGMNAGADDYVSKSGDFAVLKARVRAQLRRKQFEDEYRRIRDELMAKELEAAQAGAARKIAEARAAMVDKLERKNRELDAFAYSVSHDLRAPLRAISGFAQAIIDDCGQQLPAEAHQHLGRVQRAARQMSRLIDALLELSRCSRTELFREQTDVSNIARSIASELSQSDPKRNVRAVIEDGLSAVADAALLQIVLNNLLGNAFKFTAKQSQAEICFGSVLKQGRRVYFVKDNGVGFDSARAKRLFQPFERLHAVGDFPGAGIGLATVRRIIERHEGEIWAESSPGQGATFYFTLEPQLSGSSRDPHPGQETAGYAKTR